MSDAGATFRCPACGAPNDPKASSCSYCRAAIHALRCPWCFEWQDSSRRDCPRCGAAAVAADPGGKALRCPGCRDRTLDARALGGAVLCGCGNCGGVWADAASFKKICEDRSTQAAYLGEGSALAGPASSDPSRERVLYRPCASCGELMNRFNFAACSGVVLDACKPHGVWFDPDELRRIVAFIRGGGLDVAREREKRELELERRRLRAAAEGDFEAAPGFGAGGEHVASASGLVSILLGLGRPDNR